MQLRLDKNTTRNIYSKGRFDAICSGGASVTVDILCFRGVVRLSGKDLFPECLIDDERPLLAVRFNDRCWDQRFGLVRSNEFYSQSMRIVFSYRLFLLYQKHHPNPCCHYFA